MVAKWLVFVSRHFDFGENLIKHFPEGVFQWNLARNRDHEYINIAEIKLEIFIPVGF